MSEVCGHTWILMTLVLLSVLSDVSGTCRRRAFCMFESNPCEFHTGKRGLNLNSWMTVGYQYRIPVNTGSFVHPHIGSQDKSGDTTVDLTSPALCSDASLCVTFDYIIPTFDTNIQVLTQCGGRDTRSVRNYSSRQTTWQSASVVFPPCANNDTTVVFRGPIDHVKVVAIDSVEITQCPVPVTAGRTATTITTTRPKTATVRPTSTSARASLPTIIGTTTTTTTKTRTPTAAVTGKRTSSAKTPLPPRSTATTTTTTAKKTTTPPTKPFIVPKSTPRSVPPVSRTSVVNSGPSQAAADSSSSNNGNNSGANTTYIAVGVVLGVVVAVVVAVTAVLVWRRSQRQRGPGTQSAVTMEKLEEEKTTEENGHAATTTTATTDGRIRGVVNKLYVEG